MTECTKEEKLVELRKRVEFKDRHAMRNLAMYYGRGELGLQVDQTKCIELLRQSADLGCPSAQCNLGNLHSTGKMGLEQNENEAVKYWEKAAGGGHILARRLLGCIEYRNGNHVAAMRHLRLSASGGCKKSMDGLIICFKKGLLRHGDLAETLQAMYLARAEMKSKDRDEYIAYLKWAGKYKEEYDM